MDLRSWVQRILSPDDPWCRGKRCEVKLAGVGKPWGMCLKCGRHWGTSHPGGDGMPLGMLRGKATIGMTLDFSDYDLGDQETGPAET